MIRVVDGDTAQMQLDNGGEEGVRFIGVDTPESVAPGQPVECFGKKANHFTTDLIEGEQVVLRFGEERRDRYDRVLAYVYLDDRFVNAELVRLGIRADARDRAERGLRREVRAAPAGSGERRPRALGRLLNRRTVAEGQDKSCPSEPPALRDCASSH